MPTCRTGITAHDDLPGSGEKMGANSCLHLLYTVKVILELRGATTTRGDGGNQRAERKDAADDGYHDWCEEQRGWSFAGGGEKMRWDDEESGGWPFLFAVRPGGPSIYVLPLGVRRAAYYSVEELARDRQGLVLDESASANGSFLQQRSGSVEAPLDLQRSDMRFSSIHPTRSERPTRNSLHGGAAQVPTRPPRSSTH